ncbi:radical SAM protein [bacterium]|nr:radical SAM protein [candidate division CSSED10-310 bacterium]
MELIIDRILQWARGNQAGPVRVDLNPTNRCNLQCRSCWMRAYEHIEHSTQVPGDRLIEVVDEGAALGVKEWEITGGGEPLCAVETTPALIRRIKQLGMYGSMTTNGTMFTTELIAEMVEMAWDKIVFSLDGADAETNDYLRGKRGAFERIVTALTAFRDRKQRNNARLPLLQFNTVLSHANHAKLEEFISLAAEFGVANVCFEPITVHSSLGAALVLTDEDRSRLPAYIERALVCAESTGVWTNAANYREERMVTEANRMDQVLQDEGSGQRHPYLRVPCYEPWFHLVIKTDGAVGPCCIFNSPQAQNIKSESLAAIWYGTYLQRIRDSLLAGRLLQFCAICNAGQVAQNRWLRSALSSVL